MAVVIGRIRQAAVLGAGVMGAQIAAHLANAGMRVLLLDVTREAARDGLARAHALKPDPFFTRAAAGLIGTGGFDEDLAAAIPSADWIIEAIVERLDAKQALLARVDAVRDAEAIVSSNTSGIPIAAIAEGRSDGFRRHWLGTHFFNPPRYLHLLELIPTAETLRRSGLARCAGSPTSVSAKGSSSPSDVPGFIANRIGDLRRDAAAARRRSRQVHDRGDRRDHRSRRSAARRARRSGRSDIAGVDMLAHVARSCRRAPRRRRSARIRAARLRRGDGRAWADGCQGRAPVSTRKSGDEILTLDPATLDLSAANRAAAGKPRARQNTSIRSCERITMLYRGDDRVGHFLRTTLAPALEYAANLAPTIAYG